MLSKRELPCGNKLGSALIGRRLPTPDGVDVTRFSQSRFSTVDGHKKVRLQLRLFSRVFLIERLPHIDTPDNDVEIGLDKM